MKKSEKDQNPKKTFEEWVDKKYDNNFRGDCPECGKHSDYEVFHGMLYCVNDSCKVHRFSDVGYYKESEKGQEVKPSMLLIVKQGLAAYTIGQKCKLLEL